jgi:hypothetical protein
MTVKRTTTAKHRQLGWAALLLLPAMLGAKGCDVAVVGSDCGGIAGVQCGRGQFCDFAPDAACGAADQFGTCQEIPNACTRQFDPVCGCDDKTYGNECEANAAGISVATRGECASEAKPCGGLQGLQCGDDEFCSFAPDAFCGAADQTGTCTPKPEVCADIFQPVCGCDDQTYGNACEANGAGVSVASEGACQSQGNACGGLQGLQCGDNEFCSFAPDAFCGAADQTGTCAPKPEACIEIFQPVCGCDGNTYGNSCQANSAGVSVASQGECQSGGGGTCGGLLGGQCADNEFCDFPRDAFCGAADQTGACTRRPEACDLVYDPVCGCDDKTYGNACEANVAGVSVASEGECDGGGSGGTCGGLLGAQCADNQFCNFAPDAQCGAADQTGTCEARPEACTLQFDPVCGCDDRTYGNACEAHSFGVSVLHDGECETAGAPCGGLQGLGCDDGEFCDFPPGAFCGAADQTGTCRPIPEICTLQADPVCGCDDVTYGNACAANSAGVSVASAGECP